MTEKLINTIKMRDLVVPYNLFVSYKNLGIEDKELIFLIYIINTNNSFNPKQISEVLGIKLQECMMLIESLTEKDLINIKSLKNNGIIEEIIDLDNLYKKMAYSLINEESTKQESEEDKTDIYSLFEKEFGRTLSPIEYELIGGWSEENSEEVIALALKEAVYNGVNNLRYIDKILHEWNRKGLNTKEKIEKDKMTFNNKKVEKRELFDYDWLNEE